MYLVNIYDPPLAKFLFKDLETRGVGSYLCSMNVGFVCVPRQVSLV
jgi:hypothetical protein